MLSGNSFCNASFPTVVVFDVKLVDLAEHLKSVCSFFSNPRMSGIGCNRYGYSCSMPVGAWHGCFTSSHIQKKRQFHMGFSGKKRRRIKSILIRINNLATGGQPQLLPALTFSRGEGGRTQYKTPPLNGGPPVKKRRPLRRTAGVDAV